MATRAPGLLVPRDGPSAPSTRASASQKDRMVAMLVVAAILILLLVTLTPRPDIVVQAVTYAASGCSAGAVSQTVTASFTLYNQGPVDGTVEVRLLVDGNQVATQTYAVFSGTQVSGRIGASIPDCSAHRYSLTTSYEAPAGG